MIEKKQLNWKFKSPDAQGFHVVVSPENSACRTTWGFRLNLEKGTEYRLSDEKLELNGAVISRQTQFLFEGNEYPLSERDSFYLPANHQAVIQAKSDLIRELEESWVRLQPFPS